MQCQICGATLRDTNRIGVCTRTPKCNAERTRRVRRQQSAELAAVIAWALSRA